MPQTRSQTRNMRTRTTQTGGSGILLSTTARQARPYAKVLTRRRTTPIERQRRPYHNIHNTTRDRVLQQPTESRKAELRNWKKSAVEDWEEDDVEDLVPNRGSIGQEPIIMDV